MLEPVSCCHQEQPCRSGWGHPECSLLLLPAPSPPRGAAQAIASSRPYLLEACPPGKAPFARIQELVNHPELRSSSSGTGGWARSIYLFPRFILREPEHLQRRSGRIPRNVTHPLSNVRVIQSGPRACRHRRRLLP